MTLPIPADVATAMSSVNAIFTAFPIVTTVVGLLILAGVAFDLARHLRGLSR